MDILLISGFLGAGKTTLIRHLLQADVPKDEKLAVIVNEVGDIGIDGSLLSGQDVDILELTSGCICCTIKTDFFKAVQEIHRTVNPTYLFVETTGVAQPGDMLDVLFEPPLSDFSRLKNVITVIDAGFFKVREVLGTFYDNQIRCADIIILNKIDAVKSTQLKEIESVVRSLNPQATMITAKYCAVELGKLFKSGAGQKQQKIQDVDHFAAFKQSEFKTFSFTEKHPLARKKLEEFLGSLPPTIFRCKGWVRFKGACGLLNYAGSSYRIEPVEDAHFTSLVFVGRNCDEQEILNNLKNCLEAADSS
jgi:G3E family GTPase